jgi:lysophospholipase L1-like esterase
VAVIRRTTTFAACALTVLMAGACGADGESMTAAADVFDGADDPVVDDPVAPESAGGGDVLAAASEQVAPTESESSESGNPNWPPVTLAPGEPPVMPASVNVIGDSIALSAQPILTKTFESLGVEILAYDAVESRRMVSGSTDLPSGASAIEEARVADHHPELWIIALGTNDIGAMANSETVRADLEQVLDLVPADAHLIWVDTWFRDLDDLAVAFNAMVRDALAERPYTTVLDWHGQASIDGLIISDGVHLSEVGKIEYARMIGDGLRAAFDRG